MVWYFQSSPHDTHDWDSTQTPVLIDGEINGQPRKLLAQAARNGYFFVLDRDERQEHRLDRVRQDQLGEGLRREGPADSESGEAAAGRRRARHAQSGRRHQLAAAQLQPADRAVLRQRRAAYSVYYIYDPDDNPQGWGGTDRGGYSESMIQAIDYKTGKIKWTHKWEAGIRSGLLSTAGNLLFTATPPPTSSRSTPPPAMRSGTRGSGRAVSNGPITYELDGTQYLVVGAGDTLWAFAMQHAHERTKPAAGR